MPCRTEMVQAREQEKDRVPAEAREQEEAKARAEEEDEEWTEPAVVQVDQWPVRQATVRARNAVTRLRIRSDLPAAGRAARSAGPK